MDKVDSVAEQNLLENDSLELARQYVSQAVNVLNKLGPRYEKISWVLEDALMYFNVEDDQEVDVITHAEIPSRPLVRSVDCQKPPTEDSAKTASGKN